MANFNLMTCDTSKCPCRKCDKRHAFCHGECQNYKEWVESKPKTPINLYSKSGKMTDPFHKKGRVITK